MIQRYAIDVDPSGAPELRPDPEGEVVLYQDLKPLWAMVADHANRLGVVEVDVAMRCCYEV